MHEPVAQLEVDSFLRGFLRSVDSHEQHAVDAALLQHGAPLLGVNTYRGLLARHALVGDAERSASNYRAWILSTKIITNKPCESFDAHKNKTHSCDSFDAHKNKTQPRDSYLELETVDC